MRILVAVASGLLAAGSARAQFPVVTHAGETMRLRSASVVASGSSSYDITLVVENDNGNAALPSSFRRWWHCEIGNLDLAGVVLAITVDSTGGYSDVILPVWALSSDGSTFTPYQRCPPGAVPQVLSGGRHRFTLAPPPGTRAIRLAKYFPYTVSRKDAFLQSVAGHPHVRRIASLGSSAQGRPIQLVELTDGTLPDAGKTRIWIHAGAHPAETTSYFTLEGLVAWLLSGDPWAEALLDRALLDLVPMANPDGVFLGNYRVNANSANLEDEWAAPYASPQPEIVALRTAIEQRMGTVAAPGPHPIRVLLNLHSSHNVAYPFHFQHTANANWHPVTSNAGVLPIVHQLEGQWIQQFRARSAFVDRGTTMSSSAGAPNRPFVESMMHDRWTAVPGWLPGQPPVMAITFEGTYGRGPDGVSWNTEADYRLVGSQLGLALCDHLGITPTASSQPYGTGCGPVLACLLSPLGNGSHQATFTVAGAPAHALAFLVLGFQQQNVPLPQPWSNCNLLCNIDASAGLPIGPFGIGQTALLFPALPGLAANFQVGAVDLAVPGLPVSTTNGVRVRNDY